MALVVGTNSWATVAEADDYFSTKYGAASIWGPLDTTTEKEPLLISAYNWIQQQSKFSISPTETADIVKQAQYETAWYIYNYKTAHDKRNALYSSGVREFDISKWGEKLEMPVFPVDISDMLGDYLTDVGGVFVTASRTFDR